MLISLQLPKSNQIEMVVPELSICYPLRYTPFFFYKNQKILAEPRYCYVFAQFEPQLFLNCSCFDRVNYTLRHCHRSFSLVFKNTCGTVLIFFSAHSVFITDDHLTFRGERFFRSAGNCFQRHLACKKFFAV